EAPARDAPAGASGSSRAARREPAPAARVLREGAPVVGADHDLPFRRQPMLTLRLPDGSTRQVPGRSRPREVAEGISKRLAKDASAARVDGDIVDLERELPEQGEVAFKILTDKDPDSLDVLRHSSAHVMARAVMRLFPGTQLAFGPALANGF